jgi:hypothetical protein
MDFFFIVMLYTLLNLIVKVVPSPSVDCTEITPLWLTNNAMLQTESPKPRAILLGRGRREQTFSPAIL